MEGCGDAPPICIIKFGGSILDSPASIRRAARAVRALYTRGLRPLVVVSALKGATDGLARLAQELGPPSPELVDEILSMGERTSARLFCAALQLEGLSPALVEPSSRSWPVVTDARHQDANPLYELSRQRARRVLLPLLSRGKVPVVCGYLGKTRRGRVTTLGRGGSDASAVLLASCLGAREVILVKDVDGVYSGDPKGLPTATRLPRLSAEEALLLTNGGARLVQPKALRLLREGMKIRVTSLAELERGGTEIEGPAPALGVRLGSRNVTLASVLPSEGEGPAELLSELRRAGLSCSLCVLSDRALLLCLEGGPGAGQVLHGLLVARGKAKAVSQLENLAELVITGGQLELRPGILASALRPLAERGIKAYGLVTLSSSVHLFVDAQRAEEARELIGRGLSG